MFDQFSSKFVIFDDFCWRQQKILEFFLSTYKELRTCKISAPYLFSIKS